MNETIANFIAALNLIERIHYEVAHASIQNDNFEILDDKNTTYENNFVAQLNTKYAILEDRNAINEPAELTRQLQFPKTFHYYETVDENFANAVNRIKYLLGRSVAIETELKVFPDFIIHKTQDDIIDENQRLIAEVKTENELQFKSFLWDFFKINLYVEKLNFQNGVFLIVNTKEETVKRYLTEYVKKNLYFTSFSDRIVILVKENYDAEVREIKLDKFLK